MKRLFLLLALFGVFATGCEELLPNEQTPNAIPVFSTDGESSYIVDAEGEEIAIMVTTNIDYSVVIPTDAEEWLSVADTRASRVDTLSFIVAPNDTAVERTTTVKFVDDSNNILQTISFTQNAAAQSESVCPNNEIWYTNGSTTEATTPYKTDVFGANIVSNTYDAAKECWIIKFDGDVTTIGEYAFNWCDSLTSVTIPDSVTTIGGFVFNCCSSLTSVTIGNSVTTIGEWAFVACYSLTSITIPDSVTTIGDGAFADCSSLQEFKGKFASEDSRCLIVDGILNSFAPAGLTEYTIYDSVTSIGDWAFAYCGSLTSVTIPDSVTSIGSFAFYICSSLTSVTIPDSVTTIGDEAFVHCTSLTSVTIGDSVTEIGGGAFYNCSSLTSVTIGDSVTMIGESAFRSCSSLTSVTIGDSVTTIGEGAFGGCSSLTSITIPDSVTKIGNYAFANCSSLTSVYCKATTPPSLGGTNVFDYNNSGRKIYVPTESVNAYKSTSRWSEYALAIVGYNF